MDDYTYVQEILSKGFDYDEFQTEEFDYEKLKTSNSQ